MAFNNMVNVAVDPNLEEKLYLDEVAAVKQWWADSRWRYTKRPFTAEQIVAKRGNLKIEYASNTQSKKLWKILEGRFQVRLNRSGGRTRLTPMAPEQRCKLHLWLLRANHVNPDGKIPRYRLRFRVAILFHCLFVG
jgi:Isocitrate lyase family